MADRISKSFADGELAFLTISGDRDAGEVKKIIAKVGTSLPVLLDRKSSTVEAYRVRLLPTLYLIDKEQKIVNAWTGSIEDREAEIIDSIKSLLKSDTPSPQE